MFDFEVAVIIPMAGVSVRFPSPCQKQYFKISGKRLFLFCVEEFYRLPFIKKICLVSDNVEFVRRIVQKNFRSVEKFMIVAGGRSRHCSIKNGLIELSKFEITYKVVVIHDGVRPAVPEGLLIDLIAAAAIHGAAGATRPLISTVVKPSIDGYLEESLERNSYLLSETPQAFLFQLILSAYKKITENELAEGTECLELTLRHCGVKAKLIPGPETLWKVTDRKDFYATAYYLKETTADLCLLGKHDNKIIGYLLENLKDRVKTLESYDSMQSLNTEKLYNIVVCIHHNTLDVEMQKFIFTSLLDSNRECLLIHIVEHDTLDHIVLKSVCEVQQMSKNLMEQCENTKNGIIVIHFLANGKLNKLSELIASFIHININAISGQTLIL